MSKAKINKIVIAGGGTAGWMMAAGLSKLLGTDTYDITLIESQAIGTIGVGEATIPTIQLYTQFLGIDEKDFMQKTNATFKLGIEFENWTRMGESYFHPFGSIGRPMNGIDFIHYWLRNLAEGGDKDFGRFNTETRAARVNKANPVDPRARPDLPSINYAYQFDATLVAKYLRSYAEDKGINRIEGEISAVEQEPANGYVTALTLKSGMQVPGDLFIDCTGFASLLIGKTLNVEFVDWSHWLPCNSAVAVPCEMKSGPIEPYTRSIARESGWQWRIPLQNRVGNGYVYASQYLEDDAAKEALLSSLEGKALAEPKVLKFTSGHRKKIWHKNVIAAGLAGGFIEPLESTAIYLVQSTITKLLAHFPKNEINPHVVELFNRKMTVEYQNIRDFLVAHYKFTEREDSPFWRYCKQMSVPDSLLERVELFKATANCNVLHTELFKEHSWFAVLIGQGCLPESYHPLADILSSDDLSRNLSAIDKAITERVNLLKDHREFLHLQFAQLSFPKD